MTQPLDPGGLGEVAASYDAILCDVWGVLHNGRWAFSSTCTALMRFREEGGRVVLITNAPVPKARVTRLFEPLGVPAGAYDDCVSSGDATRAELVRREGQAMWLLGSDDFGPEHDAHLYRGLDLRIENSPQADFVLVMGLRDQANDHPEDYRAELARMAQAGLIMICANPDIQVRVGDQLVWCAGELARIHEAMGAEVTYPGKPHPAIYRLARERLSELGLTQDTARLLAIGDGPATDIAGANREGIDSLYVGTGIGAHRGEDFESEIEAMMAEHGVAPTYAMAELHW